MTDMARDGQRPVDLSESKVEGKRPGVDFPVAIEYNGHPVVMTRGQALVEGNEYPPSQQHELPEGFAWVGPDGGSRKLIMGREPDPHERTIQVSGQSLEIGTVYPSSQQHELPPGYKWGRMLYGLDGEGGVNRQLLFEEDKE